MYGLFKIYFHPIISFICLLYEYFRKKLIKLGRFNWIVTQLEICWKVLFLMLAPFQMFSKYKFPVKTPHVYSGDTWNFDMLVSSQKFILREWNSFIRNAAFPIFWFCELEVYCINLKNNFYREISFFYILSDENIFRDYISTVNVD